MFYLAPAEVGRQSVLPLGPSIFDGHSARRGQKTLDSVSRVNVIIFTDRDAAFSPKTTAAASGRRAQPQSRRRHRRVVSAERVSRSRRCGSGQVRDVAASATRGTAGERRGSILWVFQALLLSGTSRFRRGGPGRFITSQTRTKRRPQVDRRSDGLRWPDPGTGSGRVMGRDRQARSATVSDFHSPAQYRSPVEPSKKTQLSVDESRDGRLSGARREGVDRCLLPVVSTFCSQPNSTLSTLDALACASAKRRDCSPHRHAVGANHSGGKMNHDVHQKVKASHLQRTAYLYVRQSSLRQVFRKHGKHPTTVRANKR
jgi:hypothetical protein